MRRRFGKNDRIFIGILAVVCVLVFFAFRMLQGPGGSSVTVTRDGEVFGTYSLSQDQRIEITDEEGKVTNVLVIEDGKASMTEADCPDKLCVHQKAISAENENIVCLPNRIVVTVTDSTEDGFDAMAQ